MSDAWNVKRFCKSSCGILVYVTICKIVLRAFKRIERRDWMTEFDVGEITHIMRKGEVFIFYSVEQTPLYMQLHYDFQLF